MVRLLRQWLPRSRRGWLIFVALLALAFAMATAAGIAAPPYYHRRAAERALQRYDFDDAQRHLDAYLKSWPKSAATHLVAARTARRRGAYADAEQHLAECERLQGVAMSTAREWAMLRAQQGDLAGVESSLRAMVEEKDPDAPLALEALARGYFVVSNVPQTIACLDLLLDLQPDHFPALLLRGRALEAVPDDDEALRDYERAVALKPASTEARLRLANTLNLLGRTWEAVGQYECLRQRHRPPVPPEVFVGLARCRYDLHEMDEARRLLDDLLAEAPDHVPGLVERGRLALREHQPDVAERDLRRAVELAPVDRDAHLVLSHCLEDQGKNDEARQVQRRLGRIEACIKRVTNLKAKVEDFPHDPELRREIGALLLDLGEEQQGLRWLWSALQENQRHAPTHAALADYFERMGRTEEAAYHRQLAQQTN